MSSTPRAWPGVTVPADHYAGERFTVAAPPGATIMFAVSVRRNRLVLAVLSAAVVAQFALIMATDLRLLPMLVSCSVWFLASRLNRVDVAIIEATSGLTVQGTSHSSPNLPIEVTRDEIRCIRPRSTTRFVRIFRPEVWQVGPERIIVANSTGLTSLRQRLEEVPPS